MPGKGQKLSKESIEQVKKSKLKKLLSKFKWKNAESYYDINLNMSSRNRKLKVITLRQFKNNIENGKNLKSMIDEGIQCKLLCFYSQLCQGKIKLTKENFIRDYENGSSIKEIAEKYRITEDSINFLRQLYQIKIKGATFLKRKRTEVSLTQKQKEIIYGSLMGDASRLFTSIGSAVSFCHSVTQEEYIKWKYFQLKNLVTEKSFSFRPPNKKQIIKNKGAWAFYTRINSDIEEIINKFYVPRKEVSMEILNNLTPLSIAIWYADDGCTCYHYSERMKNYNPTPICMFCTDSFSKKSCENIIKWFEEKWGIKTKLAKKHIRKDGGRSYHIYVKGSSMNDFISLIEPHMPFSMRYKVDYETYVIKRKKNSYSIEKSIKKRKKTQIKKLLSNFKYNFAKPYYHIELKMTKNAKKTKTITLKQFKNYIENGENMVDIRDKGYSTCLSDFCNHFFQGKIKITKEKFIEEYKNGLSLREIAEKYKIQRKHIIYLLQLYEIDISKKKPNSLNS